MFSPDDTIVAIATPPGRGGIGVVRVSGPRRAAGRRRRFRTRTAPLEPRRATLVRVTANSTAVDRAVAHVLSRPALVHRRRRGGDQRARQPVCSCTRSSKRRSQAGAQARRAGRVHVSRLPATAGSIWCRPRRCSDLVDAVTPLQARAAFDQLEGTLTARIREIDAALFELIARLEASLDFPDEGYHFVEPEVRPARSTTIARQIETLLADAGRGRLVREGAQVAIVGRPELRQIQPLQSARRRGPRDRHRHSRDDARSGHRGGRHRRDGGHAGRHGGPAAARRPMRSSRKGSPRARAAERGRRPGDRRARCIESAHGR